MSSSRHSIGGVRDKANNINNNNNNNNSNNNKTNNNNKNNGNTSTNNRKNKAEGSSTSMSKNTTTPTRTTMNNVTSINNQLQIIANQVNSVKNNKRIFQESPTINNNKEQQKKVRVNHEVNLSDSDEEGEISDDEMETQETTNNQQSSKQEETTEKKVEKEFVEVKSKKDKIKEKIANQLAAIRIRISEQTKSQFNNPIKIKNEIQRCFTSKFNTFKIKFMEFAKYDQNVLVIATDDKDTHDTLNNKQNWPNDAFIRGIQLKTRTSNNSPTGRSHGDQVTYYNFSIIVNTDIDIGSTEVVNELERLGFCKGVRTIKKTNYEPTAFVRLTTTNKELYEAHVYRRQPIKFFYQRYYSVKEIKPHQCWNCQGLGHLAFDCPDNEPTCMQCGEKHRFKKCPHVNIEKKTSAKTFCSNCKVHDHNSASRQCPKLKEHVAQIIKEKKEKKEENNSKTAISNQKNNNNGNNIETTYKHQQQQQKETYASKVIKSNEQSEIKILKQQVKDLLSLFKVVFTTMLSKQTIEIPSSLKTLFNE